MLIVTGLLAGCGETPATQVSCFPTDLGRPAGENDVQSVDAAEDGGCPRGFTDDPQIDENGKCTDAGIKAGTCRDQADSPPKPRTPPPVTPGTVTNPQVQTQPCNPHGGISDLPPCP